MPDLFPTIIAVVAILVLIIIILTGYLKAPPDTAYIVSGLRRRWSSESPASKSRCLSGWTN